jgi:hypothetical protein
MSNKVNCQAYEIDYKKVVQEIQELGREYYYKKLSEE